MTKAYACDYCRTALFLGEEEEAGWVSLRQMGAVRAGAGALGHTRHFCSLRCAATWLDRAASPRELPASVDSAATVNGVAYVPVEEAVLVSAPAQTDDIEVVPGADASKAASTASPRHIRRRASRARPRADVKAKPKPRPGAGGRAASRPDADLREAEPPFGAEAPSGEPSPAAPSPPASKPRATPRAPDTAPSRSSGEEAVGPDGGSTPEPPRQRLRDLLEGAPTVDLEAMAREQARKRPRFGGRR